ncbi:MAG: FtsX-like permease family protein [Gemmatimonadetes bacterium]|nr:FtsX-like permease family protein [Gemmatimonadota bacterium]
MPLHSSEGGEDAAALFGTLGTAVFFVLLIACMNAPGLLMTRARSRTRELSLRAAIGAGRVRLAFTLMAESVLLALLGGGFGLALGTWGLQRAFSAAPPFVRELGDPKLNGTVVTAGLGIALLAALMAGLPPALRASRMSVASTLRDGSAQSGDGSGAARLRRFFVVGELALSLALLTAAFMTVQGFQRQLAADPGFEASSLLSFTVKLPAARYGEDAMVDAYYEEAVAALERHPTVQAASSTSRLPLGAGGISLGRSFIFEGADPPPNGVAFPANWVEVDPGWFDTMGLRAVEGRAFNDNDGAGSEPVAIVNATMANRMSPEGSIVGRVIRSHFDENVPRRVVGVLADIQMNGVSRERRQPMVLVPRAQASRTAMAFLVRTEGDPADMAADIREIMAGIDSDVAVDGLQPLREAHSTDLAGIRFLTTLFASFGVLALILAVGGVYGLVSYSVSQRTQEFGVRMAMGASSTTVRRAVLKESAVLATIGLPLGLALAWAAGRVLSVGMDGIAIPNASTYVVVALLLVGAVLLATWIPAARATRVDPVSALRSE